jgi:hypothetical protein
VTALAATFFFGVLGWFLLSVLFATPAHADDRDPLGDLLGGVAQRLGDAVEPLASTMKATLEPVAAAAQPLVSAVGTITAPVLTPVGAAAAPAVQAVTGVVDAAAPALSPVTRALERVTAPVLDAVTPVADLVTSVPGVDAMVPPMLGAVGGVVAPGAGDPGIPPSSTSYDSTAAESPGRVAAELLAGALGERAVVPAHAALVTFGSLLAAAMPVGLVQSVSSSGEPFAPARGVWPLARGGDPATFFTSSMNALGLASALALGALGLAHRAWARRRALGDEPMPGSPAFPTDASPD